MESIVEQTHVSVEQTHTSLFDTRSETENPFPTYREWVGDIAVRLMDIGFPKRAAEKYASRVRGMYYSPEKFASRRELSLQIARSQGVGIVDAEKLKSFLEDHGYVWDSWARGIERISR